MSNLILFLIKYTIITYNSTLNIYYHIYLLKLAYKLDLIFCLLDGDIYFKIFLIK